MHTHTHTHTHTHVNIFSLKACPDALPLLPFLLLFLPSFLSDEGIQIILRSTSSRATWLELSSLHPVSWNSFLWLFTLFFLLMTLWLFPPPPFSTNPLLNHPGNQWIQTAYCKWLILRAFLLPSLSDEVLVFYVDVMQLKLLRWFEIILLRLVFFWFCLVLYPSLSWYSILSFPPLKHPSWPCACIFIPSFWLH